MEYSHIQQLTEDFKPSDTLDYKFDTLMEITDHFCMDYREDLKRGLGEDLRKKLKSLLSEYESRVAKLESMVASIKSY